MPKYSQGIGFKQDKLSAKDKLVVGGATGFLFLAAYLLVIVL